MFSLKGTVLVDLLTCTYVQVFFLWPRSGRASEVFCGRVYGSRLWFAFVVLMLARENFADVVEGVDFVDGLVWAKAEDAGES